jgi:hypothetical protein
MGKSTNGLFLIWIVVYEQGLFEQGSVLLVRFSFWYTNRASSEGGLFSFRRSFWRVNKTCWNRKAYFQLVSAYDVRTGYVGTMERFSRRCRFWFPNRACSNAEATFQSIVA